MGVVDLNKLGQRRVEREVVRMVEDKATGLLSPQPVVEQVNESQPILTLEEAKQLVGAEWKPSPIMLGHYQCVVQSRRFFVPLDIYDAMFPPGPKKPEPLPATPKKRASK